MKKPALLLVMIALLAACASMPMPSAPTVSIAQTSVVKALNSITREGPVSASTSAANQASRVPVDYRFTITNPLSEPVTLKAVEMETVGLSGGYLLKRVRHSFDQVVPAGASSTLNVRAWVQPLQESQGGRVVRAVMIHGIARFDAGGKTIRTAFSAKLEQSE